MASTPQFYDGAISGDVVASAVDNEYEING